MNATKILFLLIVILSWPSLLGAQDLRGFEEIQSLYLPSDTLFQEGLSADARGKWENIGPTAKTTKAEGELPKPTVWIFFSDRSFDDLKTYIEGKEIALTEIDRLKEKRKSEERVKTFEELAKKGLASHVKDLPSSPLLLPDYRRASGWTADRVRLIVESHRYDTEHHEWILQTTVTLIGPASLSPQLLPSHAPSAQPAPQRPSPPPPPTAPTAKRALPRPKVSPVQKPAQKQVQQPVPKPAQKPTPAPVKPSAPAGKKAK